MRVKNWSGEEKLSVREILVRLNQIRRQDPEGFQRLLRKRVPLSLDIRRLEEIPAIGGGFSLKWGPLELLNALFGVDVDGRGPFMEMVDGEGSLVNVTLPYLG
jgi:hypothetical protein